MKIIIDKITSESYLQKGIVRLAVSFINSGCQGTKVEISEDFEEMGLISYPQDNWMTLFVKPEEAEKLDDGRITRVGDKWIFSSERVQSHCGCGSSFSFEKNAIDPKKLKNIARLLGKQESIVALGSKMNKNTCE